MTDVAQDPSRILIVDDDPEFVRLLHLALSRMGYHVERALSGAEGLDIADSFRPHVIVTDLMMPGLDGTAFCEAIKSRPHLQPVYVIMLTAKGGTDSQISNLRMGADDYVVKPAGMRTLKARIEVGLRWVEAQGRLRWLADNDSLTALPNRHMLDRMLEYETTRALAEDTGLSLILIDLDQLKQLNDDFGHAVGDVALRRLADIIRGCVRSTDFPARYGGDEFAIILPDTDKDAAILVAQRVRKAVSEDPWPALGDPISRAPDLGVTGEVVRSPTVSVGVATLRDLDEMSPAALMRAADIAAYHAKNFGRDRVQVYSREELTAERSAAVSVQERSENTWNFSQALRRFLPAISVRSDAGLTLVARSLHASGVGWVREKSDAGLEAEESIGLAEDVVQSVVSALPRQAGPEDVELSSEPLTVVQVDVSRGAEVEGGVFHVAFVPSVTMTGELLGGVWLAWDEPVPLDDDDRLGLRWLARLLALEMEAEPTPLFPQQKGVGQE
jgi:diguanylate cyclase (GGDEF)-like protein